MQREVGVREDERRTGERVRADGLEVEQKLIEAERVLVAVHEQLAGRAVGRLTLLDAADGGVVPGAVLPGRAGRVVRDGRVAGEVIVTNLLVVRVDGPADDHAAQDAAAVGRTAGRRARIERGERREAARGRLTRERRPVRRLVRGELHLVVEPVPARMGALDEVAVVVVHGVERRVAVDEVHLDLDVVVRVVRQRQEGVLHDGVRHLREPADLDLREDEEAALFGRAHAVDAGGRHRRKRHRSSHAAQSGTKHTSHVFPSQGGRASRRPSEGAPRTALES